MMNSSETLTKYLLGIFDDENHVISATVATRDKGIPIHDVYTPYPVHGLDSAMGIKRSRLPIVCFIAGSIGFLFAMFFQLWVFGVDWPIIVGGKPFAAIPAFVPVTFEITVLVGGLVTVAAFLFRSKLFPGAKPVLLDPRATCHHFVLAIEKKDASLNFDEVAEFLKEQGAIEVRESEVIT